MPRGHASKRESKKPKKKPDKPLSNMSDTLFTSAEVEVVKKKRKSREEDWE